MNFIEYITILLLSVLPSLILLGAILYSDRKSREPLHLILLCIFSGFLTIILSLLIGQFLLPTFGLFNSELLTNYDFNFFKIIIFALIEELCKFSFLYFFIYHNKNFDDIYDGFVYSSIIAISFAVLETILYVFSESELSSMKTLAILRDFTAIPLHLVCGIIMGYYFSLSKFSKGKKRKYFNILISILIPSIVHFAYNSFFSFTLSDITDSSVFMLMLIIFLLSIYALGFLYFKKTTEINKKFLKNEGFNKEYHYLMHKEEFDKKLQEKLI